MLAKKIIIAPEARAIFESKPSWVIRNSSFFMLLVFTSLIILVSSIPYKHKVSSSGLLNIRTSRNGFLIISQEKQNSDFRNSVVEGKIVLINFDNNKFASFANMEGRIVHIDSGRGNPAQVVVNVAFTDDISAAGRIKANDLVEVTISTMTGKESFLRRLISNCF